MTGYLYIDTETGGLDIEQDVWEIAYAIDDEPIQSSFVSHSSINFSIEATRINHYTERAGFEVQSSRARMFEQAVISRIRDERFTVVGSNPEFDMRRLEKRWSHVAPESLWNHRYLDVCTYAMGALGLGHPVGLEKTCMAFREMGYTKVTLPDHTAAGDVAAARSVHRAAQAVYA